jgi:hypothetical protein
MLSHAARAQLAYAFKQSRVGFAEVGQFLYFFRRRSCPEIQDWLPGSSIRIRILLRRLVLLQSPPRMWLLGSNDVLMPFALLGQVYDCTARLSGSLHTFWGSSM